MSADPRSTAPQPEPRRSATTRAVIVDLRDEPRVTRSIATRADLRLVRLTPGPARTTYLREGARLCAITTKLGVPSHECVVLSDRATGFRAAAAAGLRSIGLTAHSTSSTSWRYAWPDTTTAPDHLPTTLTASTAIGPVGEISAAGLRPSQHRGSLLRLTADVFALGRYFSTRDPRSHGHALSRLVLDAKRDPRAADRLGAIIADAIPQMDGSPKYDVVVSVPPRPDQRDRLASARRKVAAALSADDGADLLEMRFDVKHYRWIGHAGRTQHNEGRFTTRRSLPGRPNVLLVDDVITSGAQTGACTRALLDAGAAKVTVLVAAASQTPCRRIPGATVAGSS